MVVIEMPKKKTITDGRKLRYLPLTLEEMQAFRDKLQKLAGKFTGLCEEMERLEVLSIDVEGRAAVEKGLESIRKVGKEATGVLAGESFDDD